ncbi:hypothetical protein AB0D04_17880, partial [Streptomyces sp. NPDC048483]
MTDWLDGSPHTNRYGDEAETTHAPTGQVWRPTAYPPQAGPAASPHRLPGGVDPYETRFPAPYDTQVPAPYDTQVPAPYDAGPPAPYDAGPPAPYDAGPPAPYDAGPPAPYDAPLAPQDADLASPPLHGHI